MNVWAMIMLQAFYYAIVMFLSIFLMIALLKGFFIPYFRVRISFGKYVLVKVRNPLRDYFRVGWVDEGFLVYKHKKDEKRICLDPKNDHFYSCMSVKWIDVDDISNSIAKTDFSNVDGFDAIKFSVLLKRALMKPSEANNMEKMMIIMLILIIIVSAIGVYLTYVSNTQMTTIINQNTAIINAVKGLTMTTG